MNKILKIAILLALVPLGYFFYEKKSIHYLEGNPLLLIDHLGEEHIRFPGMSAPANSSRLHPLNDSWKLIETRRNKSSIWTIPAPGSVSPGTRNRLLYKGKPVHNGDVLQRDGALPVWDIQNGHIWLAHDTIEPPAPNDYIFQQKVALTKEVSETILRKLTLKDLVCLTDSGSEKRNVYFLSLPEGSKTGERFTTLKMGINGSKTETRYGSRILNSFYQTERVVSLHSADEREEVLTLSGRRSWKKSTRISSGRWVLHFAAKGSFHGKAPMLEILLNHRKVGAFAVANQDWKNFYLAIRAEQNSNDLELKVSGKPDMDSKSVIFLEEVSIWPSDQTDRIGDDSSVFWEHTDFWQTDIYQPAEETVLNFSNTRPLWTKSRYFLPGPFSILISARTDGEESAPLPLGIYLGKKRIGKVLINGAYTRQYSLETFSSGGWSAIKLLPDPIAENSKAGKIYIQKTHVYHPPGILISTPAEIDSNPDVTVNIRREVPIGPDSLRAIISQNPLTESFSGFLTSNKMVGPQSRHSFLLRPRITLEFPVLLPRNPVLKFSFTADGSVCKGPESPELIIRLQPAWGLHKTLLRKPLKILDQWVEQEISLEKYSDKHTILTFEARSPKSSACQPDVWVANPILASKKPGRKPKTIIVFSADALRADHLGVYGYSKETSPALDRFSKESVLFTNAISQAPWTLPSFSSLLTSLYPSFHGAYYRGSKLESTHTLLSEILKKKNFLTAGFTKNGFLNQYRGFVQGFDWYHAATAESKPDERLDQIITWLEQNRGQDLFLLMHFLEPHSPYEAPEEYIRKFVGSKRKTLDTSTENLLRVNDSGIRVSPEERDYLMALYDAEIAHLDSIFARFRRKLEELGLYDSALIVFLSDHGEEFQDHGKLLHTARLYQELVRVPLIIKFPAESGIGSKRISTPVALLDVMPTILNYLNIQSETSFHGRSLLPLIQKKGDSPRMIITERNDVRMLGLIDGSHKYIYSARTGTEELYDLENDPHEKQNLAGSRLELLEMFRKKRHDFVTNAEHYRKNKQSSDASTVELSEEEEQNLRALGYVQ